MAELDGRWNVERVAGFLPPLIGVRKEIEGARGRTTVGPIRAPFDVVGRELRYTGPFTGFVDVLEPDGSEWAGRALYRGRVWGEFRLTRR